MTQAYVLDRALILERLGGDEEIFMVMVDMYLDDVDNYCATLDKAYKSGDPVLLHREAHTVKGLLASFGDEPGAKCAHAVEIQAKQGELAGLDGPIADILARMHEVAAVLRRETGR